MPTPDPSASLTAYQSWVTATAAWAVDAGALGLSIVVLALMCLCFLLGALVVQNMRA